MANPSLPGNLQFASLYVGDLHPECGEATLYEAFSQAGNVASCRVCRDSVTKRSLGYGYVNYFEVKDAERALDTLNYMSIKGKPCRVMWAQKDPVWKKSTANNVFVKNLDADIDNKALHDTFSIFGNILSCKVCTTPDGKSRGYGFVHYEAEEAAKTAIEKVNGMMIGSSTVFVGPFIKREEFDAHDKPDDFTNLYVKHMPPAWDDKKLTSVFGEFGEVTSSVIMSSDDGKRFALVNFRQNAAAKAAIAALHRKDMRAELGIEIPESAEPSGDKSEDAPKEDKPAEGPEEAAVKNAGEDQEKDHPDYLLYVQRAQTRAERKVALEEDRKKRKGAGKGTFEKKAGVRLCIRNLAEEVTEEKLREIYEPFGSILAVIIRTDEVTGKSRGLGFVVLSTAEEAAKAIEETNGKEIEGKALNVVLSERKRRGPEGDGGFEGGWKGQGKGKGKGGKAGNVAAGSRPPQPAVRPPYPSIAPFGGQVAYPHYPPYPGPPLGFPLHHLAAAAAGRGVGLPGYPYAFPPQPQVGFPPIPMIPPMYPGLPRPPIPGGGVQYAVPTTMEDLTGLPPAIQKQRLGERLYILNCRHQPQLAGKLTGMMLELSNAEILELLDSEEKLKAKIGEAVKVLQR